MTGYDGPTGVGAIDGTAGLTGPPGGELTVIGPGTQVYQAGSPIRLQLNVQPGPDAPQLTATGLPGLVIGANQVLTGTAPTVTGVHWVTVTASYSGQTTSASFNVVIVPKIKASHPATGVIRLNGGAWCLTGAGYRLVAGTTAVLDKCAGKAAQKWSLQPGGGTAGTGLVKINGRCLTAGSGSGNGAKAMIQSCAKDSTRQQWTYQASGHLRNAATGTCLAVRGSAKAGRQVVVWSCTSGATVGWVLPAAPVLSALAGRCLDDPGSQRCGWHAHQDLGLQHLRGAALDGRAQRHDRDRRQVPGGQEQQPARRGAAGTGQMLGFGGGTMDARSRRPAHERQVRALSGRPGQLGDRRDNSHPG